MKKEAFKTGMGALLEAFPDKKFDCAIFWAFLSDLSDREFLQAIGHIISVEKNIYPGTNVIALIREKAKVQNSLSAAEAWGIVQHEITRTGSYGKPDLKEPIVEQAVDIIGWQNLCRSEAIGVERAHFLRIYETLLKRRAEDQMLIPIDKIKLIAQGVKT